LDQFAQCDRGAAVAAGAIPLGAIHGVAQKHSYRESFRKQILILLLGHDK
jgi:hypothetical protein